METLDESQNQLKFSVQLFLISATILWGSICNSQTPSTKKKWSTYSGNRKYKKTDPSTFSLDTYIPPNPNQYHWHTSLSENKEQPNSTLIRTFIYNGANSKLLPGREIEADVEVFVFYIKRSGKFNIYGVSLIENDPTDIKWIAGGNLRLSKKELTSSP